MAPCAQAGSGRLSRGLLLLWGKCVGSSPGAAAAGAGGSVPRTAPHAAALPRLGPRGRGLGSTQPPTRPGARPAWQRQEPGCASARPEWPGQCPPGRCTTRPAPPPRDMSPPPRVEGGWGGFLGPWGSGGPGGGHAVGGAEEAHAPHPRLAVLGAGQTAGGGALWQCHAEASASSSCPSPVRQQSSQPGHRGGPRAGSPRVGVTAPRQPRRALGQLPAAWLVPSPQTLPIWGAGHPGSSACRLPVPWLSRDTQNLSPSLCWGPASVQPR